MAQLSNDLRKRLLAALPQPENLTAYREETAALLAKHATALRWNKIVGYLLTFVAIALMFLWNHGPWQPGTIALHALQAGVVILFFMAALYFLRYEIYAKQITVLKEIKQVQLQILELQASLRKD